MPSSDNDVTPIGDEQIEELERLIAEPDQKPGESYPDALMRIRNARQKIVVAAIDLVPGLLARLRKAEAIVAKLPVTADGVPIVPGMTVWVLNDDNTGVDGTVEQVEVRSVAAGPVDSVYIGYTADDDGPWADSEQCYSTRDAALAAASAGTEPGTDEHPRKDG